MQAIFGSAKAVDFFVLQRLYVSSKFIRSVLRCQSEQDRPAVPGASSFSVGLPVFTQFPQPPTSPHYRECL